MQVFVDLCGEGTVSARVQPDATLGDLKWALLQASPEAFMRRYSYFTFLGKPLQDASTIASQGITNLSTLHLRVRVLGGGGDGGATGAESRDCYLNMYATKKPDKVDPNEARLAKWSRCTLSSEALKPPCVVDLLGNMYNKEALVAALLSKSLPKELKHIKGLKDMVPIHLSSVPGIDAHDEKSHTKFQCPVSGQELNGRCKFYVLRACGHVLSAKALKEVQSSSCLVCYTPYAEPDKLVINGTEEEVLELKHKMEEEALKKKEKKSRNGLKEAILVASMNGMHERLHASAQKGIDEEGATVEQEKVGTNGAKRKLPKTDKVQAVAEKSKDSKVLQPSKKFKAVDILPPNATKEVYASIFSSSSKTKLRETYMCRALPLGRN
ncbi:hypothetical protein GOP47_0025117 [Adiantum capillus-veneris]|uniref:Ubiquitin-like domain-containing protein n=1 Tax=Adiantum capillus-veneris TaxID=13818 RepID=A0A9D4Z4X6_ADICA|nr:hypothetical protein GOP47_0025117 [Adiantum capillus-veneris]